MVIEMAKIISTDIRSRSNAKIIRTAIYGVSEPITLDFSRVSFISRSFADELCNIIDEYNGLLSLSNTSDLVHSMIEMVSVGRQNKRIRLTGTVEMREFKDMESLSTFLTTI